MAVTDRKKPPHERRRSRRFPSDHVRLELVDGSGKVLPDSARLYDLSAHGACFDSPLVLSQEKPIQARLHSVTAGLLRVTARIIWAKATSRNVLYGVEFVSLASAGR